jgi:hypothetical protein
MNKGLLFLLFCGGVILVAHVGCGSDGCAGIGTTKATAAKPPVGHDYVPPPLDPISVRLKSFKGTKDGFGSVLTLNMTIENTNPFPVKDVVVECTHSANSGTVIDSNRRTVYETVKAKGTKTLTGFNMGFIHSQAARSGCFVMGFERG